VTKSSQQRAVANHRRRLAQRGFSRYEVRGLAADKELVRNLAKRLAANDREAAQLRAEMAQKVGGEKPTRGGILAALRRSPLVGADLELDREFLSGRDTNL
jgi:hypothetical protein